MNRKAGGGLIALDLDGTVEYWGDSDEDEGAAQAAGVPFVRVDRFFGEVEP